MKKAIKKLFASLLVVAMLLTSAPMNGFVGLKLNLDWLNFGWFDFSSKASAEENELSLTGQCGDNVFYTFYKNTGTLIISGTGKMGNYSESRIFNSNAIKNIIISEGVTSIGESAFYNCTGLTSVTIGNSVTSIGDDAFYNCTSLTSITIPNSVTSIGNYAFKGCTGLTKVNIHSIEAWCKIVFSNDSSNPLTYAHNLYLNNKLVADLAIPDSVTSISEYAFYNCTSLTSVAIGNSVTSLGVYAFNGCTDLINVTIPNSVTSIGNYTFNNCTALINVTIPNSVTSIGNYTFNNCTGLINVTISNSVTSIGDSAFKGCTGLTKVNIHSIEAWCKIVFSNDSSNPLTYAHNLYLNNKLVADLAIPDSVTSISEYAFYNCTSLTSVTIPNSVTSLGDYAFYKCSSLTNVKVLGQIINIKKCIFSGCTSLIDIELPDSVLTIETLAFSGCKALKMLALPKTIKIIEYGAIRDTSIESITLPNTIESLSSINASVNGSFAAGASKLKTVIFEEGIEEIPPYAFKETSINDVTIPDSVTSIGDDAFYKCTSLTSITIPNSVTSIGHDAFQYCTGLTNITIPDSVTSIVWSFNDTAFYNNADNWENNALYIGNHLIKVKSTVTGDYSIKPGTKTISNSAFYDCKNLTSIIIPNSVTSIGKIAFDGCTGLTSVTIPDSVTSIGDSAFSGCTGLTSITIPDSVTEIGDGVLNSCSNLTNVNIGAHTDLASVIGKGNREKITSIIIGDGVTRTGGSVFSGCTNLESVTIGKGVTSIDNGAFSGCTGLKRITIPGNVKEIDSHAFYGCSGLTNLVIENGVSGIGNFSFKDCTSLANISLPDSIQNIVNGAFTNTAFYNNPDNWENGALYIGNHLIKVNSTTSGSFSIKPGTKTISNSAFYDCKNLTSIIIPNSVTSIDRCAFYKCTGLTGIDIPNSVTYLGEETFRECSRLTGITIPNSVTGDLCGQLFFNCTNLKSVIIGNGITSIGDLAFYNCSRLTSVTIPDSVTSIGNEAFYNCSSLTSVTIGDSVTSIGNEAFRYCTSLTSVTIGDSVTSIGDYAFKGCTGITSVTIGNSVTSIGNQSFSGCTGLTSVTIPNSVTSIGFEAFLDCSSIISVSIANSVTKFSSGVFAGCKSLTNIIIPESITTLDSTFSGCTNLTNCSIPNSVTSLSTTFKNCTSLTNIIIPNSVTRIGDYTFSGCTSLTSIIIPNSVTNISNYSFSGCTSLTNLSIPNSVTRIGDYTFSNCINLTNIKIGNSVEYIGDYVFVGCSKISSIDLPQSLKSVGDGAFTRTEIEALHIPKLFVGSNLNVSYGKDATKLKSVVFAEGSTVVSNGALAGSVVESVIIPNSVTSIGSYAFSECTSLTNIIIPNSVTSIGGHAFSGCTGLTDATIPYSVTGVGSYSFSKCIGLSTLLIPNTITKISSYTFNGCENLKSVIIPDTIKYICSYAFYGCSNLTDVYYGGTKEDWEKITIYDEGNTTFLNATIHYNSQGKIEYIPDEDETEIIMGTFDSYYIGLVRDKSVISSVTVDNKAYDVLDDLLPLDSNDINEYYRYIGSKVEIKICNGKVVKFDFLSELDDGFQIFASKATDCLKEGDSSQYMIGYFKDKKLSKASKDFITTISDTSVISISIAGWDKKYGRQYNIKALHEGESTLTVMNPETGESSSFTFYVSKENEVYNFNNLPVKIYEDGKNTNFYNYSGMVVNDIKCTPNYDSEDNNKIINYDVDMTVYNKTSVFGAVTAYDKYGNIYDYCIIDRKPILDTSFTASLQSFMHSTKDCIYLCHNEYFYSGKSITKETKVSLHVPPEGHILISNDSSESEVVAMTNAIHIVLQLFKYGADIAGIFKVDETKSIVEQVLDELDKRTNLPETAKKQIPNVIMNLLRNGNWDIGNADKFVESLIEKTLQLGVDIIELTASAVLTVSGIAKTSENLAMIALPTGNIIKGLYKASDVMDFLGFIAVFGASSCFPNGICISAPCNSNMFSSNGVVIKSDKLPENTVVHAFRLTSTSRIPLDNNTDWLNYSKGQQLLSTQYDITLYNNGNSIQPNQPVKVYIPIPTGYNAKDLKVFRVEDNNSLTDMKATVENGYAVFETTHFSIYMITAKVDGNEKDIEFGQSKSSGSLNEHDYIKFTPSESGQSYFYSVGPDKTIGYIYDDEMNLVGFDDNSGSGDNFKISYEFEAGKTYYLQVKSENNNIDKTGIVLSPDYYPNVSQIVSFESNEIVMSVEDTYLISEQPSYDKKEIEWNSFDDIISVDNNGVVTAKKPGSTIVSVTSSDGKYVDYCFIRVVGLQSKGEVVIDNDKSLIYGFAANKSDISDYFILSDSSLSLAYGKPYIGTGTSINLVYNNQVVDSYDAVLFGDVNGDGWYDGMDAVVVSLIANGMFTKEQLGEAVYMAADCNHDGAIDQLDVDILQKAGVLLSQVDQSKSEEELIETSSVYVQYLNLIQQSPETETTAEKVVEDTPTDVKEPEQINWFEMFVSFLKTLLNFVYGLFTL